MDELLSLAFQQGKLKLEGQFVLGSNYTFLVDVHYQGKILSCPYINPRAASNRYGIFQRTPWLCGKWRHTVVSEALDFHFVPFTTLHDDGPHGPGSLQQYIEYDPEYHYFNFNEEDKAKLNQSPCSTCWSTMPTERAATCSSTPTARPLTATTPTPSV